MTTHTYPAVDVIVPTRDRPELLRTALDAILAQDYPGAVNVLVVFDRADPDDSLVRDDAHRGVRVLRNSRAPGLAGARNTGLLAATAPYVAFCDDDDRWLSGKLVRQISALEARPDAVLASCGITVSYGETSTVRRLERSTVGFEDLLRSRLTELHPSTFVMRREPVVGSTGLVEEAIPGSYGEDYEFLLRIAKHAPIVNVPEVGVEVLWHRKSYFTARWATIADGLTWLLDRYPEFTSSRRGYARVSGQVAFAYAANGERRSALRWSGRTFVRDPREPRAYLAAAVAARLVTANQVLGQLHRRGRGV